MTGLQGYLALEVRGRDAEQTRRLVEWGARAYGARPLMRLFTLRRVIEPAGVGERDTLGMVRAVFEWVRDRVRFSNESGEQVLLPDRVIAWGFGDCDDKTTLAAAMLESIGIPWRTVLLARRGVPFHIYPQARVGGRWLDLEVSDQRARFGEDPRALMARLGLVL